MNKYNAFITYANYLAFLALLCAMPYGFPFIRFFGLVWVITWVFELRFVKKANLRLTQPRLFVAIGFALWVLWNALSLSWAADKSSAWATVQRDLYMLCIPLVMLWGVNERYNWKQCVKVLTIGCVISVGVYLFTLYWLCNAPRAWDKHTVVSTSFDWWHMDCFILDMKHRLHYTTLICLTIAGILSLLIQGLTTRKQTVYYCLAIPFLILAMYKTGSRTALINLTLILVIAALWYWTRHKHHSRWQQALAAVFIAFILLGGAFALFKLHPRNHGITLHELVQVRDDVSQPSFEPRIAIWQAAFESPKDYALHGLGAGNSYAYIWEKYRQHGWSVYTSKRFSTHNQFIATCIELGAAAAVLFLLFWLTMPFLFRGKARYWIACICAICLVNLSTDLFFGGVEGITFTIIAFVCLDALARPLPAVMRPQP
ncbi:MAG: O-antigen ligase family protein [Paludibacteraceae bacterium]|nr:O-antigen ligase family protein [Paludibacteraceae bacterium]